jgi:hypothetical protein
VTEIGACLATPDVFHVTRIPKGSIKRSGATGASDVGDLRCCARAEARREGRDEALLLLGQYASHQKAAAYMLIFLESAGFVATLCTGLVGPAGVIPEDEERRCEA